MWRVTFLFTMFFLFFFFFFKQKTAYEVYQCDWSSDECSSDLAPGAGRRGAGAAHRRSGVEAARQGRAAAGGQSRARRPRSLDAAAGRAVPRGHALVHALLDGVLPAPDVE